MEKIVLVFGENEYLVNKRVNEYVSAFDINDCDYLKIDLKESTFSEVYEEIITPSLFSSKKIIVVSNVKELIKTENSEINAFINYLKNPSEDTLLILTIIEKTIPVDDITNELLKYAYLDEVSVFSEDDYKEYCLKKIEASGYKIDDDALIELLGRTNHELFLMDTELEKLMLYKYNEKHISYSDVSDLVSRNVEDHIYELANSIIQKNKKKALEIYHDLLFKDEDPLRIMNNIATKLKEIIITKEMVKSSSTQDDIAKELNVSSGRAYHMKKTAESIALESIFGYVEKLALLDYEIKSGQKDKKTGVEFFLLSI